MPIRYERDDQRRLITATFTEPYKVLILFFGNTVDLLQHAHGDRIVSDRNSMVQS
jgi:hypothetical protein